MNSDERKGHAGENMGHPDKRLVSPGKGDVHNRPPEHVPPYTVPELTEAPEPQPTLASRFESGAHKGHAKSIEEEAARKRASRGGRGSFDS